MKVTLIASTKMHLGVATDVAFDQTGKRWDPSLAPGKSPDGDSSLLSEFAGRACYGSFDSPNEKTRSNPDYLRHIIEVQHGSVLEHGSATFYITDVSRSLTHELVRHRHHSYSQLSQRFVVAGQPGSQFVTPPLFEGDGVARLMLERAWVDAMDHYDVLMAQAQIILHNQGVDTNGTEGKKRAREAARCVLPNMTPTAIVVTGNHRAWRELLVKRGTLAADAEIRRMACDLLILLRRLEPNLYQDLTFDMTHEGIEFIRNDQPIGTPLMENNKPND